MFCLKGTDEKLAENIYPTHRSKYWHKDRILRLFIISVKKRKANGIDSINATWDINKHPCNSKNNISNRIVYAFGVSFF